MDEQVLIMIMSQIVIWSIFLILVFLVVKLLLSIKSEKRIASFAMEDQSSDGLSIADLFLKLCLNTIKLLSRLVSKSQVLKDYAKHFEKYLIYHDKKIFTAYDYVSLKFLAMLGIQMLYVISISIKYTKFSFPIFLIGSLISFFSVDLVVVWMYKKQKKLIEEQLLQAVVMMNSAFKSGKNIYQAISIVKKELPSPIKDEFSIIYKDLTYGLDISLCFERFYNRVKIEEAKYITSSLSLLRKTGGNIVTVFNMIEKNFYDRLKIKNELEALTSSSKFLYRMLISLPVIFVLVIVAMNPSYFNPLINTKIGCVVDAIILILYIAYIAIIKRMMRVEEV